ncbi:MAG: hypothetical protein ORN23_07150 [Chthoniobacterales bacterium]|nr:hypothetical protein [Chthoniobacterales bacterium]
MNAWWQQHAPRALELYGPPLLSNGSVNHEILGAALGELPIALVYSRDDGSFWYNDYARGGFCRTSRERVEILFKIIVGKAAAEEPASTRNVIFMLRDHAKKVVDAARAILEVDPGYWEKNKRVQGGSVEKITPKEGIAGFVSEVAQSTEDKDLPVALVYTAYSRYCHQKGGKPLPKMKFIKEATQEISTQHGSKMRNDLRDDGGKLTRGWKSLSLRMDLSGLSER